MDDSSPLTNLKMQLKMRLVDVMDATPPNERGKIKRSELQSSLNTALDQLLRNSEQPIFLSPEQREQLLLDVVDDVMGLGPLDDVMNDETISEIMINGPFQVFIERDGRIIETDLKFKDNDHLLRVIERLLEPINRNVNESEPICDATLPNGARLNIIIPPVVLNGAVITIRRASRQWRMQDYLEVGMLSPEAAEFLECCVRAKVNMLVSGGTSTGKTTLVTVLSECIEKGSRIITIENVPELDLIDTNHWIRMVAKSANIQGKGEIALRELVKNALRMRPDRIILGEARGGEAFDVVQAMHSGHDGFITVLHANTARGALERMETLMLLSGLDLPAAACRVQIESAIDLVVHVARYADGSRRVANISQVMGTNSEGYVLEELFKWESSGYTDDGRMVGECRYTEKTPKFLDKFKLANVAVPSWVKQ